MLKVKILQFSPGFAVDKGVFFCGYDMSTVRRFAHAPREPRCRTLFYGVSAALWLVLYTSGALTEGDAAEGVVSSRTV